MTIDGKVAGLVSITELTLNVGKQQGVREGDTAIVYRQVDVTDPDSKKDLGAFRLPKVELKVTFVADRFSLAETVGTVRTGASQLFSTMIAPQRIRLTTKADEASAGTILIAIGDPVFIQRDEEPGDKGTKPGATRPDKPKPPEPKQPAA